MSSGKQALWIGKGRKAHSAAIADVIASMRNAAGCPNPQVPAAW